jgi:hypothetical protein
MGTTIELEDELDNEPLETLKKMLGIYWDVTQEGGRFICSREGAVYHTSDVYIGAVYKSVLFSIAMAARQAYGSRF